MAACCWVAVGSVLRCAEGCTNLNWAQLDVKVLVVWTNGFRTFPDVEVLRRSKAGATQHAERHTAHSVLTGVDP